MCKLAGRTLPSASFFRAAGHREIAIALKKLVEENAGSGSERGQGTRMQGLSPRQCMGKAAPMAPGACRSPGMSCVLLSIAIGPRAVVLCIRPTQGQLELYTWSNTSDSVLPPHMQLKLALSLPMCTLQCNLCRSNPTCCWRALRVASRGDPSKQLRSFQKSGWLACVRQGAQGGRGGSVGKR